MLLVSINVRELLLEFSFVLYSDEELVRSFTPKLLDTVIVSIEENSVLGDAVVSSLADEPDVVNELDKVPDWVKI